MPYDLDYVAENTGKKKTVKEKQKLMRELRVIESCVNILHIPFAKGVFSFSEIKQDESITSICKLTYLLLGKIVSGYPLNELYAAQWIRMYLKHVLLTTSANQIGADLFCTRLSDENQQILRTQFKPDTIRNFIRNSKRNLETPRLLDLLTALCSCQGVAIIENQNELLWHFSGSKCDENTPQSELLEYYKAYLKSKVRNYDSKIRAKIDEACDAKRKQIQGSKAEVRNLVRILCASYETYDQTQNKFMIVLRKQKKEKDVKICLDKQTDEWIKFQDFISKV